MFQKGISTGALVKDIPLIGIVVIVFMILIMFFVIKSKVIELDEAPPVYEMNNV
jgi:hypothetical protein